MNGARHSTAGERRPPQGGEIVWVANDDRRDSSNAARFMRAHDIDGYHRLHARSVEDPEWFWGAVVEFLGIPFSRPFTRVRNSTKGVEWTTWFDDGLINLSVVCVDRWARETPDAPALIAEHEDGTSETLTFVELLDAVERCCGALQQLGVTEGDAVAVYLPMSAEAVIAFLGAARAGAIFVPIFSGYGPEAVATRLTDPPPNVLICANGFTRRGTLISMKEIADEALSRAGDPVDALLVVDYSERDDTPMREGRDHWWSAALDSAEPAAAAPTSSEDPVVLAYTSGTTGRPKGAVHVHGGFTIKMAQEGAFQADLKPGDRLMWATDMGWIMGPWMVVAGLANGASIVAYDGAPDHPGPDRIWEIVAKHSIGVLGISPTFIRSIQPHGSAIARRHDLSSLTAFGSTGEPWNPDPWMWLFNDVGRAEIPIVNLSGGTEIGACILSVDLLQGIKPVSLGLPSLGMAAEVVDAQGTALRGEVGELVVTDAWPGMTRGFWGEPERYLDTYWRRIPGVWMHGDWASIDDDGFWFLHGRSDDTLNIAGKRVGPAEIESAAVAIPEIVMAAAIGVPDPIKGEAVVVYVVADGSAEVGHLPEVVSSLVVAALGKAFRPRAVVVVDDLPRTRSAKIMRRVVRSLALGEEAGDLSSLENPESLDQITELS